MKFDKHIYLNEELNKKILDNAKINNISYSQEICLMLEKAYDNKNKQEIYDNEDLHDIADNTSRENEINDYLYSNNYDYDTDKDIDI